MDESQRTKEELIGSGISEGAMLVHLIGNSWYFDKEEELYLEHAIKNVHEAYRNGKIDTEEFEMLTGAITGAISAKIYMKGDVINFARYNIPEKYANIPEYAQEIFEIYAFGLLYNKSLTAYLAEYTYLINKMNKEDAKNSVYSLRDSLKDFVDFTKEKLLFQEPNLYYIEKLEEEGIDTTKRKKEIKEMAAELTSKIHRLRIDIAQEGMRMMKEYKITVPYHEFRESPYTFEEKKALIGLYNAELSRRLI